MAKKVNAKELNERLSHKWKNVWENIDDDEKEKVFELGEEYKNFLDKGKTEREATDEIVKAAIDNGYIDLKKVIEEGKKVAPGMKIYAVNKNKGVAMFIIGSESLTKGMNIVGSHIDAPRIDIKQFPLYEDSQLALLKTHYYGGIKKYQWVNIPLALHGIIIKSNGEKINIVIGEDESDPVFVISDILPHLAKDQMNKKMSEGITGEGLNIVIGNIPYDVDEELDEKIKLNILNILNKKYGITEYDFTTAELEAVPAMKARDTGLDRGIISAYGHDDRVCAYASLKAILDVNYIPKRTSVALFVDKEEIGSVGNTGMHSSFFENCVAELLYLTEKDYNDLMIKRAMSNSMVLSGDVAAAVNPNFPDVLDKRNAPYLSKGLTLVKYTGSRGKGGCNDANSEYISYIRKIFDENNVIWQMGELGKVDQGGGGTIAYILANYGMEVVDCGVPVVGMHSPYELISKADLYMAYKGYNAFYKA